MYHCLLRFYLKKDIQIPPKMEEEDAKQVEINKLKLTQAELQIAYFVVCEIEMEDMRLGQITKNALEVIKMLS